MQKTIREIKLMASSGDKRRPVTFQSMHVCLISWDYNVFTYCLYFFLDRITINENFIVPWKPFMTRKHQSITFEHTVPT